jgi:hypothetical protein
MIAPTPLDLPLYSGATFARDFAFTAPPGPAAPDWTGAVVRLDLRRADRKKAPALVALASDAPASALGSTIAVAAAGPGVLTVRVRLSPAETAALPYDAQLGADLEVEYPSGDVDRLARITFTTDGEFTHA